MEEVHGAADLAVVPLLGLLDAAQVGLEVGLAGPRRSVDALKLRVAVVAAPVSAGQLRQLERLAGGLRRGKVRPAAKVLPAPLSVDADLLVRREPADDLGLVVLADGIEVEDGVLAVPDLAPDRLVAVDDLLHPRLDLCEVVQAERLVAGEVVVEAVLDRGPDRHLRPREQLLHRLGHDVADVVADGLERLRRLARQDFEAAAFLQRAVEVEKRAVEFHEHRLLLQRFGDGGGDVAARNAVVELAFRAVGEDQVDHVSQVHVRAGGSPFRRGGGTGS